MAEQGCQAMKGEIAAVVGGLGPGGRAVARRLAEEGAIVILCDLNDAETAAVADQFASDNLAVQGMGIDITSPESVSAAFDLIAQTYGDPTLLCYGVGFHLDTPVDETEPGLWRHGLLSNLDGAWLCARELVRRLRSGRHSQAAALFLLSELGEDDDDALTAATRAGVAALARTLEQEYRAIGLRAGVVVSGPLPGSGAERVFRQRIEREGRQWGPFLERWKERHRSRLTLDGADVAEVVVRFACGRIRPEADGVYFTAGTKSVDAE